MAIYPEFIPPIKDYIKLITSRQFDKVRYGNGQPMADIHQKTINDFLDPVELGGQRCSFKEPEDSDFDEASMFRFDDNAPPLLSEDGEYIGWHLHHEEYPNIKDLPPLEISLPSSIWQIYDIKLRLKDSSCFSLDVFLRIDNNCYSVCLAEIRY